MKGSRGGEYEKNLKTREWTIILRGGQPWGFELDSPLLDGDHEKPPLVSKVSGRAGGGQEQYLVVFVISASQTSEHHYQYYQFERSFTYGAPYKWNKLDERVRRLSSFNMFKSDIKTVLFQQLA